MTGDQAMDEGSSRGALAPFPFQPIPISGTRPAT